MTTVICVSATRREVCAACVRDDVQLNAISECAIRRSVGTVSGTAVVDAAHVQGQRQMGRQQRDDQRDLRQERGRLQTIMQR